MRSRSACYLSWNVFDFEFSLRRIQRRTRLERVVAEEPVDDSEAEDVVGVRVPLNHHRRVLAVGVFDDDIPFCSDGIVASGRIVELLMIRVLTRTVGHDQIGTSISVGLSVVGTHSVGRRTDVVAGREEAGALVASATVDDLLTVGRRRPCRWISVRHIPQSEEEAMRGTNSEYFAMLVRSDTNDGMTVSCVLDPLHARLTRNGKKSLPRDSLLPVRDIDLTDTCG